MLRYDPDRLRQRRESLGYRPERIAVELDRCVRTVTLWERGSVNPSAPQLARLADALQCEVSDFYEAVTQ